MNVLKKPTLMVKAFLQSSLKFLSVLILLISSLKQDVRFNAGAKYILSIISTWQQDLCFDQKDFGTEEATEIINCDRKNFDRGSMSCCCSAGYKIITRTSLTQVTGGNRMQKSQDQVAVVLPVSLVTADNSKFSYFSTKRITMRMHSRARIRWWRRKCFIN